MDNFIEINLYTDEGKECREKINQYLNDKIFNNEKFILEEKIRLDYKGKRVRFVLYKEFGEELSYEDFDEVKFGYKFYNGVKNYCLRLISNRYVEPRDINLSNLLNLRFLS